MKISKTLIVALLCVSYSASHADSLINLDLKSFEGNYTCQTIPESFTNAWKGKKPCEAKVSKTATAELLVLSLEKAPVMGVDLDNNHTDFIIREGNGYSESMSNVCASDPTNKILGPQNFQVDCSYGHTGMRYEMKFEDSKAGKHIVINYYKQRCTVDGGHVGCIVPGIGMKLERTWDFLKTN